MTDFVFALTPVQQAAVTARRMTLQLSAGQARFLAVAADPDDPLAIVRVLGLDVSTLQPMAPRPWLDMAARTASVSYRGCLSSDMLGSMLVKGRVVPPWFPHLGHLLDEAPLSLLILAIEQLTNQQHVPFTTLWRNLGQLAQACQSDRLEGWLELSAPHDADR